MRIIRQLKKNNGSTLVLVLFMLFMLSVTAIAVIMLTGSELSMSVMTSDRSKALLAAKAGAENAAQVIDTAVAQAQENATVKAKDAVQSAIDNFKALDSDGKPIKIIEGSLFYKVIDNSDITDIKILNTKGMQEIYDKEYKYQFWKEINKTITDLGTELKNGAIDRGNYAYSDVNPVFSGTSVKSILDAAFSEPVNDIAVTSTGEYKSPSNGSTYRRKIKAVFSLLTSSVDNDIPVTYGKLTKVRVNSGVLPSILDNKALIAEKNIISVNGKVNVLKGNTVCFGTMPRNGTEVNYDIVNGYMFGGIMAGMVKDDTSDTANYSSNFWTSEEAVVQSSVSSHDNLKANMKAIGFSEEYFSQNHKGSFKFSGDVSTAANIHTLFGSSDLEHSDIEATENTYARNFNVESESNYSRIQLNNICTYDDLKIDGNSANVKIGKWKNDNEYDNDAKNQGCLVGLKTGDPLDLDPVSSSVIVAGDSYLFINGSVFVGGSTSYNDYTNVADGKPYISGMSIQKSDSRPAEAFEKDANTLNTQNYFHYYNNNDAQNPGYESIDPYYEHYEKQDLTDITKKNGTEMMQGRNNSVIFDIVRRAMHLKFIWDEKWKNDIGYASYFNTGDIKIEPRNGEGKINGFCWGGVAANDTIYGPYNGFTYKGSDGTEFAYQEKAGDAESNYKHSMDLFIDNIGDLKKAEPSKKLSANVSESQTLNTDQLYKSGDNCFMYYSNKNVVLEDDGIHGCADTFTKDEGYLKGIIYSKKDIYVKAGTNFKGILIAEGNIVFIRDNENNSDADINIEYDKNVVDSLLQNQQIGRFFKHTVSDVIMNDPNAIVQTVKKKNVKNIKIISWKEI